MTVQHLHKTAPWVSTTNTVAAALTPFVAPFFLHGRMDVFQVHVPVLSAASLVQFGCAIYKAVDWLNGKDLVDPDDSNALINRTIWKRIEVAPLFETSSATAIRALFQFRPTAYLLPGTLYGVGLMKSHADGSFGVNSTDTLVFPGMVGTAVASMKMPQEIRSTGAAIMPSAGIYSRAGLRALGA